MIRQTKTYLILLLVSTLQVAIFSQNKGIGDSYSLIRVKKRGRDTPLTVKIKSIDSNVINYTKLIDQGITSTSLESISRIYYEKDIRIYKKERFHYKKGFLLDLNIGISPTTPAFNISFNKRFTNNLELGVGTGIFNNYYDLPINFSFIDITSVPIYGSFKYIINKGRRAWYFKSKMGIAINIKDFNTTSISNGYLLEPSIGMTFSSKSRIKHYIQLGQHISTAKGKFTIEDPSSTIPIIGSFDLLFNGTMLTYGIQIGK